MKRRSKAGGKTGKSARHKAATLKRRRTARKAVPGRRSATTTQETEIARLTRERDQALEREKATAEVLRVVSSSPGELRTVFRTILENATRLCEAKFGVLYRFENGAFRFAAEVGTPLEYAEFLRARGPFVPPPGTFVDRVFQTKQMYHTDDYAADAVAGPGARLGGARSTVGVPMLKDDKLIGAILVYRQEVRPFGDKQIALLTNFADQAVIAIENARLLNELRQRTDDLTERTADLTEALEQQTATSEVLRVISSSPGDLEPVFASMLEKAVRICDATFGNIYRWDGELLHLLAAHNTPPALRRAPRRPRPDQPSGRMIANKAVIHVADVAAEQAYIERDPETVAAVELGGIRTFLAVPMVKENELIGSFSLSRQEVRPFTDKQIALVTSFAAQAVIAIENARLLNELRQRTTELTEALEQQTATADVLKVISRSQFDLQLVLDNLIQTATSLCGAKRGVIFRRDGDLYRAAAFYNATPELIEFVQNHPIAPGRHTVTARVALERRLIHIHDLQEDTEYAYALRDTEPIRTELGVPMFRGDDLVGVFILYKLKVEPFTDKQIELVTTFADQAVIAIENVRLLNELRESLERQTATADVLKVISRSAFDLNLVLDTLLRSAGKLCESEMGVIARRRGDRFYRTVAYGLPDNLREVVEDQEVELSRSSGSGRALLEGKVVQIHDIEADTEYMHEARGSGAFHTLLGVPMLREGVPVGVMTLMRKNVQPFTEKQIDLVSTFADQAAIAIENVRLFDAEQQRTRELARSLEDLRTAQDRLVQTEKLASLGQLTAGIAHEIKNPLNFVNNFSAVSVELIDELREALGSAHLDSKLRAEISEIADTLQSNLDKVVQHGKRADAIVKNMLLHSRQGSGEHRPVDINALVDESLNLAYHGARAEKQGFNITLERSFDPTAGEVDLFPQEITRVLLNLISNGFYATTKRKAEANDGNYEPTVAAATKNLGDRVEIRIRDNGTGIPPEVREKLFNPFFTTKPAGEGTGLGLSISHDIIVKQHGGSIEVDTVPGEFTEFRIVLPRRATFIAECWRTRVMLRSVERLSLGATISRTCGRVPFPAGPERIALNP